MLSFVAAATGCVTADTVLKGMHTVDYSTLEEIATASSPPLTSQEKQIIINCQVNKETVSGYLEIRDKNNQRIFKNGDFCALKYVPAWYSKDIISIPREPAFSVDDIIVFWNKNVKTWYADSLAGIKDDNGKLKYDSFHIYRFSQLNFSRDELEIFNDTEKPNALIQLPWALEDGAFESKTLNSLIEKLKNHYDLKIVLAGEENDLYQELNNFSEISLLFLSGHGNPQYFSLQLRNLELKKDKSNEHYFIDVNDKELQSYLSRLRSDAVIFMFSCSTAGTPPVGEKNLAVVITEMAQGRKVIAARKDINVDGVSIKSYDPFDAKVFVKRVDVTYVGTSTIPSTKTSTTKQ